ncbi:hypothetical protein [Terrisporobacter sp.]
MKIMKLSYLNSHDVFEFTYANNYDLKSFLGNWNENSIWLKELFSTRVKSLEYYSENILPKTHIITKIFYLCLCTFLKN